ncbi:type A von Willebrand factor domain-containing protein [Planoprotostelium fungivorum]|uniref:Type A von Willebrand factor domain-containing protein n=1 Tax=Planoprotostelium fungivorum TaxID=1890364 RepID=A0A2P6NJY0_9EUKA|nr:type A von Willebrand factor domain-containing protein [Planoprotostelium fungivorum]
MKNFQLTALFVLLALFVGTQASHFRFGVISWQYQSPTSPNILTFTFNMVVRSGWFPDVAKVAVPKQGDSVPINQLDGNPKYTIVAANSTWSLTMNMDSWTCTVADTVNDFVGLSWNGTYTFPVTTGPVNYTFTHTRWFRLSANLKNNGGEYWNLISTGTVYPPGTASSILNNSPTSGGLAIQNVRAGFVSQYQIPTSAGGEAGDSVTFRMATENEMVTTNRQTAATAVPCPFASIHPTTGVVTFDGTSLTAGTTYQTQHIITDSFGAQIAIDYLINATVQGICQCPSGTSGNGASCVNDKQCCTGGSCKYANPIVVTAGSPVHTSQVTPPTTFYANTSVPLKFLIVADDTTYSNPVSIYVNGLPPGSTSGAQKACSDGTCPCLDTSCKNPQYIPITWNKPVAGYYSICAGVSQTFTNPPTSMNGSQYCINLVVSAPRCGSGTTNTSNPVCTSSNSFSTAACCICPAGFDPASGCTSCKRGFFGASCTPCPNCNNGTCNDGTNGDGSCLCNPGWLGTNCDQLLQKYCDGSSGSYVQYQSNSASSYINPYTTNLYMSVNSASYGVASMRYTVATPVQPSLDILIALDNSAGNAQDITDLSNLNSNFLSSLSNSYGGSQLVYATADTWRSYNYLSNDPSTFSKYVFPYMQANATDTATTFNLWTALANVNTSVGWRSNTYKLIVVIPRRPAGDSVSLALPSIVSLGANIIFLCPSSVYQSYANLASSTGLGVAVNLGATALAPNWPNLLINSLPTVMNQINLQVINDLGFFTSGQTVTATGLGATTNATVNFTFPKNRYAKGRVYTLPTPTVSALGWGNANLNLLMNRAPYAQAQLFTPTQNKTFPFTMAGTDPDNNLLGVMWTQLPNNASVYAADGVTPVVLNTLYKNMSFVYISNTFWSGPSVGAAQFTDGCDNSDIFAVNFTIQAVVFPPMAKDFVVYLNEGTSTTIDFSSSVSDYQFAPSTLGVVLQSVPQFGQLSDSNGNALSASSPVPGQKAGFSLQGSYFYGNLTFQYYVNNVAARSNVATVTAVVAFVANPPTFSTASTSIQLPIGSTYTFSFTVNDPDIPDNETITLTTKLNSHVTNVAYSINGVNGNVASFGSSSLTPGAVVQPGTTGTITLTTDDFVTGSLGSIILYSQDGYGLNSGNYIIQVQAQGNTPPVLSATNPTTLTVSSSVLSGFVNLSATDNDGTQGRKLSFTVTAPSSGTLTTAAGVAVSNQGAFTFATTENSPDYAGARSSTYGFTYTPDPYFYGQDSITFTFTDVLGGSTTSTLNLNVDFHDHPPILTVAPTIQCPIGFSCVVPFSVLDNDKPDNLTVFVNGFSVSNLAVANSAPATYFTTAAGSAQFDPQSAAPLVNQGNRQASYSISLTTDDYASGSLGQFTILVKDAFGMPAQQTVSVSAAANRAPFFSQLTSTVTGLENKASPFTLVGSDQDGKQGGNLTFFVNLPQNFQGSIQTTSNTPVTSGGALPASQKVSNLQTYNSTTTYSLIYTPKAYFNGSESVTVYLVDVLGKASSVQTITFVTQFVNNPPTVTSNQATYTCPIGGNCQPSLTINDFDTFDSEKLILQTYGLGSHVTSFLATYNNGPAVTASSATILPATIASGVVPGGSVSVNLTTDDTSINSLGSFSVFARDLYNGNSSVYTVAIVAAANRPPTFVGGSTINVPAFDARPSPAASTSFTLTGTDQDGQQGTTLTNFIISLPSNGIIYASDGTALKTAGAQVNVPGSANLTALTTAFTFTYVPTKYFHGTDSATFQFVDVLGGVVQATVNFVVNFYDSAPTVSSTQTNAQNIIVCPIGASCSVQMSMFDPDTPDNITLIVDQSSLNKVSALSATTSQGTVTLQASTTTPVTVAKGLPTTSSATLTLSTTDDAVGTLGTVLLHAQDGYTTNSAALNVTVVAAANTPPYFINTASTVTLPADNPYNFNVVGSDSDGHQGGSLLLTVSQLPSNGILKDGAGNTITANTPIAVSTRTSNNANAPFSSTYGLNYQPTQYYWGQDSAVIYLTDVLAGTSTPFTVNFNVTFVNHRPVLSTSQTNVTCSTGQTCYISFSINDPDRGDLQTLSLQANSIDYNVAAPFNIVYGSALTPVTSTGAIPRNVTNGFQPQSTFQVSLKIGQTSSYIGGFSLVSYDSFGLASSVVAVTVYPASGTPPYLVSVNPTALTLAGTTQAAPTSLPFTINGTDNDSGQGSTVSIIFTSLPVNGTLTYANSSGTFPVNVGVAYQSSVNTNGAQYSQYSLTYTPTLYTWGLDKLQYILRDILNTNSEQYTSNITVSFSNTPPSLPASRTVTCPIGKVCTVPFTVSDPDYPDSEDIIVTANTLSSSYVTGSQVDVNGASSSPSIAATSKIVSATAPGSSVTLSLTVSDVAKGTLGAITLQAKDKQGGTSSSFIITVVAGPNTPPTTVSQSPSNPVDLKEDGNATITINGTDIDGQQGGRLHFVVGALPTNGKLYAGGAVVSQGTPVGLSLNAGTATTSSYTLLYVPNPLFNGTDSFTYNFIDDLNGASTSNASSLVIDFVNHRPTVLTQAVTCPIGANCTIPVSVSDPDTFDKENLIIDSNNLVHTIASGGYFIDDGTGARDISLAAGASVASGLLSRSSVNFYVYFDDYSTGSLGSFGLYSADLFGGNSPVATVNVMAAQNRPPYNTGRTSSASTAPGSNITIALTGSDFDGTQGTKLSLVVVNLPVNGTLYTSDGTKIQTAGQLSTLLNSPAAGNSSYTLVYVPKDYTYGSDGFNVQFVDVLGGVVTTAISLNVAFLNHAPTLQTPSVSVTCPLGADCILPFTITDPDFPENESLILSSSTLSSVNYAYVTYGGNTGSVDLTATGAVQGGIAPSTTVNVVLHVDEEAVGSLGTITFQAKDSHGADSNSVVVNVAAVGDTPPFIITPATSPFTATVEGDSLAGVAIDISGSDLDGNQGAKLALTLGTVPQNGNLVYGPANTAATSGLTVPFSLNTVAPTVVGAKTLNSSNYVLTYVPNKYFSGLDSFSFLMTDPLGGSTSVHTVVVNVTFVNHPPIVQTPSTSVVCAIGGDCVVPLTITDPDSGDVELLNVTSFTVTHVTGASAATGSKTVTYSGATLAALYSSTTTALSDMSAPASVTLTISVDNNIVGDLGNFTVVAQDSHGGSSTPLVVSLVAAVSTPPYLVSPAYDSGYIETVQEDGSILITITGSDKDGQQGSNLNLTLLTLPQNGKITVGSTVVARGQSYLFDSSLNVASSTVAPPTSSYSFTYTPNQLFHSLDTFTFQLTDSTGTASVTYSGTINVTHVNHPPVGANFAIYGASGKPTPVDRFTASDVDAGDSIFLVVDTLPAFGSLVDGNGNDVTVATRYAQPDWNNFQLNTLITVYGNTNFTFHFTDTFNDSAIYTSQVFITLSDQAPVAFDSLLTGDMDKLITFTLNSTEMNNRPGTLKLSILSTPSGKVCTDEAMIKCLSQGSTFFNELSTLYYQPPAGVWSTNGPADGFSFQATDSASQTSPVAKVDFFLKFTNLPPVALFSTTLTVYEASSAILPLSAIDDHTPPQQLVYTVSAIPSKGLLSAPSAESDEEADFYYPNTTLPAIIHTETMSLQFFPAGFDYGQNYTTFAVSITDTNNATSTWVITVNVIHVNQPPTIIYNETTVVTRRDHPAVISFNGTDIDSPVESIVAVVSKSVQKGSLHTCIYDNTTDSCAVGAIITTPSAQVQPVYISNNATAVFKIVFVPINGTSQLVYAVPSFVLIDDQRAQSATYTPKLRVRAINEAPEITAEPFLSTFPNSTLIVPVSVVDPDGGAIPITLVIHVDNAAPATINFTAGEPFKVTKRASCVHFDNNRGINCTAPQNVLNNYLKSLTFASTVPGDYNLTVFVDDNGAGADSDEAKLDALTATASVKISNVASVAPSVPSSSGSIVVAVGSAVGAAAAAGAIAAVARLVKRPDDEVFSGMMDWDEHGVVDNPLFQDVNTDNFNPIYEE